MRDLEEFGGASLIFSGWEKGKKTLSKKKRKIDVYNLRLGTGYYSIKWMKVNCNYFLSASGDIFVAERTFCWCC